MNLISLDIIWPSSKRQIRASLIAMLFLVSNACFCESTYTRLYFTLGAINLEQHTHTASLANRALTASAFTAKSVLKSLRGFGWLMGLH